MPYPYYSSQLLTDVLHQATFDECFAITKIFHDKQRFPLTVEKLTDEILRVGGHSFANTLRGHGIAYTELLFDVAKALKIDSAIPRETLTTNGATIAEMDERATNPVIDATIAHDWKKQVSDYALHHEKLIITCFIDNAYQNMTPNQRAEVDLKVQEIAKKSGKSFTGLTSSAALLALANAGGFSTYMLLSTVISTLSMGAASFGVYTTASSALSLLLGPMSFAILGLAAAHKLATPNQQKALRAVVAIVCIQARLAEE